MKREETSKLVIPIWTFAQSKQAVPFIASIVRSLRENRLETRRHQREAERLAEKPGRPDRHDIIAHQEALRDAQHADARFQDALQELHALGVYCQDPIRGLALIPFVNEHLLAWFVFDLFDAEQLVCWRYHADSEETRRPLNEVREDPREALRVM